MTEVASPPSAATALSKPQEGLSLAPMSSFQGCFMLVFSGHPCQPVELLL